MQTTLKSSLLHQPVFRRNQRVFVSHALICQHETDSRRPVFGFGFAESSRHPKNATAEPPKHNRQTPAELPKCYQMLPSFGSICRPAGTPPTEKTALLKAREKVKKLPNATIRPPAFRPTFPIKERFFVRRSAVSPRAIRCETNLCAALQRNENAVPRVPALARFQEEICIRNRNRCYRYLRDASPLR